MSRPTHNTEEMPLLLTGEKHECSLVFFYFMLLHLDTFCSTAEFSQNYHYTK